MVQYGVKAITMKYLLTFLLISASFVQAADLNETQFNQLIQVRNAEVQKLNASLAPHLHALLAKAQASRNKELEVKIREELANIGSAYHQDWMIGTWDIRDSDNQVRTYTFRTNSSVEYVKLNGRAVDLLPQGTFAYEQDGTIKATLGTVVLHVNRHPKGIVVQRWNLTDYPQKAKAIVGTSVVK